MIAILNATCLIAGLTVLTWAPKPAMADFFDDARRTFQSDIPHFFQDDIPCAFGGQPTSHTKTTCKAADQSKHTPVKAGNRTTGPQVKPPAAAKSQQR